MLLFSRAGILLRGRIAGVNLLLTGIRAVLPVGAQVDGFIGGLAGFRVVFRDGDEVPFRRIAVFCGGKDG